MITVERMSVHGHFFIKDGNGDHTNAAYGDIDSSPMELFEFIPVPNGRLMTMAMLSRQWVFQAR